MRESHQIARDKAHNYGASLVPAILAYSYKTSYESRICRREIIFSSDFDVNKIKII